MDRILKKYAVAFLYILIASFAVGGIASASPGILADTPGASGVRIHYKGVSAGIFTDPSDFKAVQISAEDLAEDIELVTGVKPVVAGSEKLPAQGGIIIGAIGKSALIDELIATKKLDVSSVRGKWESYLIASLPGDGSGEASYLVIAGSDRRGTAFGAYELSQAIGVSPWSWWADVAPDKRSEIIAAKGVYVFGPPSVKYRGIFLNDEAFGLNPWSAKTVEPDIGNIGPKTYERIFELLLRLKANYIWPAMKHCTRAFNYYDRNKIVADDYAIVMGSSHCEQMLRDNIDEWSRDGSGEWNFVSNRDGVLKYWEDRVRANAAYENIYTLGMRGIDDTGMLGGGNLDEQTRRLEEIIGEQRGLLNKWVNPDVASVPQLLSPYKEVLDLYNNGLSLPDDVTVLWTDDNYGYIRRLSNEMENRRAGGSGVYYHVSYSGQPHDYLWLNTTPPALIWEEMEKAWLHGARNIWVVNAGDLKPAEIAIDFFARLAWDINSYDKTNIGAYLNDWAAREFGAAYSTEIAGLMNEYYVLNFPRKAELMGFNERLPPKNLIRDPDFSLVNNGDEARRRIEAFAEVTRRADAVYSRIPAEKRDAFYQLVLYPARCADLMNQKLLFAFMSRRYEKQGRISANYYAEKSREAYRKILEETEYYNKKMAGGKWDGMMSSVHHDRFVFFEAKTGKVAGVEDASPGVAVEGQGKAAIPVGLAAGENSSLNALPGFNRFTRKKYFIDIFNRGKKPLRWKASAAQDWIVISEKEGTAETEQRIWVSVDYEKAPRVENATGTIRIHGGGDEFEISVAVFNPSGIDVPAGIFAEDNRVIAIDAKNFSNSATSPYSEWRVIPGMGYAGGVLAVFPQNAPSIKTENASAGNASAAEYSIYVFHDSDAKLILQAIPTHEINGNYALATAVSIDDGKPFEIRFKQGNDEYDKTWRENVVRNAMFGRAEIKLAKGMHTLKIWGIDPSVILDRIVIDMGGLKESYLGPAETAVVK